MVKWLLVFIIVNHESIKLRVVSEHLTAYDCQNAAEHQPWMPFGQYACIERPLEI